jgi:hypothetical protein
MYKFIHDITKKVTMVPVNGIETPSGMKEINGFNVYPENRGTAQEQQGMPGQTPAPGQTSAPRKKAKQQGMPRAAGTPGMNQTRRNKGMGGPGRNRGQGSEKVYRGNNTGQSFPDGVAVKLINPATYMGVRTPDQITTTKQTRSGRVCGDFMARVGDGEFAFYRACGISEEQVRKAAEEVKQKFSGSDGVKGIVEDLRRDELKLRSMISEKQLDLQSIESEYADEQNPQAQQAFKQRINDLRQDIEDFQKELAETTENIQKYSKLDQAIRQQPAP